VINTLTKSVIAAITSFVALVQTRPPVNAVDWTQTVAAALASGLLVWYVPNTPKSGGPQS
jgi:hypothetical protein